MGKSCPGCCPEKDVKKHTCVQCLIFSTLIQSLNCRSVLGVVIDYDGRRFGHRAIFYSQYIEYTLYKAHKKANLELL